MDKPEKHRSYSVAFKLKVVEYAKSHGKHKASKMFCIDRKRVREWSQNEDSLKTLAKSRKRSSGGCLELNFCLVSEFYIMDNNC